MSAIDTLIAQISDPRLRERLAAEWANAKKEKKFGLVFEDHLPELLPLHGAKPRKGDLVCRRLQGQAGALQEVWQVQSIQAGIATCVRPRNAAQPGAPADAAPAPLQLALDELLVVREFGAPIFPALVPVDAVENSPRLQAGEGSGVRAAPWHTLIEADNYHALQLLEYLYAGQVDCIYIDPPYNTGARDWKYNNDYVDSNDQWRHSKWLAFMERRLKLAKRLLNPADSVLIVTIDEKEYLRLGLLLEQTFPDARVQMVSSVINPKGVPRNGFARVDEYIFVAQFGASRIAGDLKEGSGGKEVRWRGLTRTGANGVRSKSPGAFYPIYFDKDGKIVEVGDALPIEQDKSSVRPREGLVAIWPTPRPDGEDGRWSVVPEKLRELIKRGAVRVGRVKPEEGQYPIFYLTSEQLSAIKSGELEVRGKSPEGVMQVYFREDGGRVSAPRTVWDKVSHSASEHGSGLLRTLLPGRKFPFPKSLYAVEDALRFFVKEKPDALILDFFAGSGTTAHAVLRLNKQDGGRRRCICVTNNEVAPDEQRELAAQGLQPGAADWERWGICRHITYPRLKAAITGTTPEGEPIRGDYKFTDEFPMSAGFAANLAYFKLDFLERERVSLRRALHEILPLLWLKAGAVGPRPELKRGEPEPVLFAPEGSNFVLLLDETRMAKLMQALSERLPSPLAPLPGGEGNRLLSHVFIVTDADESFKTMAQEVRALAAKANPGLQVLQLYRDYLLNFMINQSQERASVPTGTQADLQADLQADAKGAQA